MTPLRTDQRKLEPAVAERADKHGRPCLAVLRMRDDGADRVADEPQRREAGGARGFAKRAALHRRVAGWDAHHRLADLTGAASLDLQPDVAQRILDRLARAAGSPVDGERDVGSQQALQTGEVDAEGGVGRALVEQPREAGSGITLDRQKLPRGAVARGAQAGAAEVQPDADRLQGFLLRLLPECPQQAAIVGLVGDLLDVAALLKHLGDDRLQLRGLSARLVALAAIIGLADGRRRLVDGR
jgi:hypothetical protein